MAREEEITGHSQVGWQKRVKRSRINLYFYCKCQLWGAGWDIELSTTDLRLCGTRLAKMALGQDFLGWKLTFHCI